jgi:serine/threonine protein phosphatase PrpC
MPASSYFLEVGHHQVYKHNQRVGGDVFHCKKMMNEKRIVAVLADGLGSGIKASVLATLTTSMAGLFVANDIDIKRAAEIIMSTLPMCKTRKIAYSTFTIVDIDIFGKTRIIEFDNPGCLLWRDGKFQDFEKTELEVSSYNNRQNKLYYSSFETMPGDRLLFFSDGVTQCGMGTRDYPLGWGDGGIIRHAAKILENDDGISARNLSRKIIHRAVQIDQFKPKDDITCAVVSVRIPRKLLVVTGPPYDKNRDKDLVYDAMEYEGKKVICGGTTAGIFAKKLNLELDVDLDSDHPEVPPASHMDGFELVTEGTITLSHVMRELKKKDENIFGNHAAGRLCQLFMESDVIEFLVGTRINEAHQDPNLPVELEIRRNLVKSLCYILENDYLKKTSIKFI